MVPAFAISRWFSRRSSSLPDAVDDEHGPPPTAAGPAAGSSLRPLHARPPYAPTPNPSPLARWGAVGRTFLACRRVPERFSEPERAEPACLGARWQVTDAPLLPRDRAPLAGANRCVVLDLVLLLLRIWSITVGNKRRNHLQLLLLGEDVLRCERLQRLHRRRQPAAALAASVVARTTWAGRHGRTTWAGRHGQDGMGRTTWAGL